MRTLPPAGRLPPSFEPGEIVLPTVVGGMSRRTQVNSCCPSRKNLVMVNSAGKAAAFALGPLLHDQRRPFEDR